ncbi:MAG: PKD domain-containing protein, partial [Bacteroidia bacterium]
PYLKIEVINNSTGGDTIPCLNYYQQGLAGVAPAGYSKIDEGQSLNLGLNGFSYPESYLYYTPNWIQNSLNLKPYLGNNLTVRFTVTGCTLTAHPGYAYVDAKCGPLALIIPNLACQGGTASLIAPPQSGGTFTWSGPTILTGAGTNSITTNQNGTYSVTIQERPGCAYTLDTTVVFYPNPTLSVNSATLCAGTTASLSVVTTGNASPVTYVWSSTTGITFTSGDTIATANPPSTTIYTITGTTSFGCKDTAVSHVTVNVEPSPTFTASAVCLGTATTFSNTVVAGDFYQWNFGDTHTLSDTVDIANPSYTYTYSGTFAVNFSVTTAGGCKSNTTQTVTVNPMPTINFTANDACEGSVVNFVNNTTNQASFSNWHWDFGDGNSDNTSSPAPYTYASAGCYSVALTATTTSGCVGSFDTTVYIHSNPVTTFSLIEACQGSQSEFIDGSYVTNPPCLNDYISLWFIDYGDGQSGRFVTTIPDTIKHTYANCGAYNIQLTTITNASCSSNITFIGDTVFCLPFVTAPPSFSLCPGTTTTPQTFTSTVDNGGPAYTIWLTNYPVTNTGMNINDTLGYDVFPSYTTIPKNLSCTPLTDVVYGIAASSYCLGNIDSLQITVYPTPFLSHMDSIKVCANQQVTVPAFTVCPAGDTISWTNSLTAIGLAASGTGNIPSPFTGINNTSVVENALITAHAEANTCIGPDSTFHIIISPLPTMTVTSPPPACPGAIVAAPGVTSTPTVGVNYNWTTTNNVAIDMAASGTGIPASYTAPANNSLAVQTGIVTYTPTLNGCIGATATETVIIKPTPFVSPITSEFFCPQQIVPQINFSCTPTGGLPTFTYIGLGGIGITQTGDSIPSFTAINASNMPVANTITVSATLNGCKGPGSVFDITVFPKPIASFSFADVCDGKPVTFTDQSSAGGSMSITSWQWDFNNDGVIDTIGQHPAPHVITPAGTDSVKLIVHSNSTITYTMAVPTCSAQVTEPVIIYPNPVVDFVGVDLKGCPTLNTAYTDLSTITTGSIVTWNWNFGNGQTSNSHYPLSQDYSNSSATLPVYYSVILTVISDQNCSTTKTKTNYIEVYPKPIAAFSWGPKDADLYEPTITFVNEAIGASTYTPTLTYGQYGVQYYLSDPFGSSSQPNIVSNNTSFNHDYTNPDYIDTTEHYPVTQWVINSYGCKDSVTEIVVIKPIVTFYIPNAFTPNGDGTNEGFKGTGIGIKQGTYNLWIFDRWGLMIYHATDLEKAWDGHMAGHEGQAELQEDVYVWKVKFSDILNKSHDYHGTVTLIK